MQVTPATLEPSEDRSRPPLDRFPSGFRMCPRACIARADAHAKTRLDHAVFIANAIRFSINAQKRQKKAAAPAQASNSSEASSSSAMEVEPRPQRAAAAAASANLTQPKGPQGPKPGRARAGPGRGHVYEPARPLLEQLREPPSEELVEQMERANWLQRVQLQKQWQTARMAELEKQVLTLTLTLAIILTLTDPPQP